MRVLTTHSAARWAQLSLLLLVVFLLTASLPSLGVPFSSPLLRSLLATVWAPIGWNVFPRLEHRRRLLSSPLGGNRRLAHLLFAGYIVAFSALRERLFLAALAGGARLPVDEAAAGGAGAALLAAGALLSGAGFARLRVRGTYMGEYFGFRRGRLLTGFPFSVARDPMYTGSALMHFGYAVRERSGVGLYLAVVTAGAYWVAARIFEEWVVLLRCFRSAVKGCFVS